MEKGWERKEESYHAFSLLHSLVQFYIKVIILYFYSRVEILLRVSIFLYDSLLLEIIFYDDL